MKDRIVRPGLAMASSLPLLAAALLMVWFFLPAVDGWRTGTLIGVSLGGAVALITFIIKLRSFHGGGVAFLGALAGGFLLNIFFLAAGTILARYSDWLGNHQGYAFGYLGAALILGGLLTWHLRSGRTSHGACASELGSDSAGGQER